MWVGEHLGLEPTVASYILSRGNGKIGKLSEGGSKAGIIQAEGLFHPIDGFETRKFGSNAGRDLLINLVKGVLEKFRLDPKKVDVRPNSVTAEFRGYSKGMEKRVRVARDIVRSVNILKYMYTAQGVISPSADVVVSASAVDIVATNMQEAISQIVRLLGLRHVIIVGDSVGTSRLRGDDRGALNLKGRNQVIFTPVYVGVEPANNVPSGVIMPPEKLRGINATNELITAIDSAKRKAEEGRSSKAGREVVLRVEDDESILRHIPAVIKNPTKKTQKNP